MNKIWSSTRLYYFNNKINRLELDLPCKKVVDKSKKNAVNER